MNIVPANKLPGHLRESVFSFLSMLLAGCGSSGTLAALVAVALILAGTAAPVTVPLVVFPGGDAVKPALLLPFSSEVQAAAVTAGGDKLYAADILHNTLSVIDLKTRRVTAVLDVASGPRYVAITADDKKVLVSNFGTRNLDGRSLTIIDAATDTVITTLEVGAKPFAIAITPDSKKAFVANAGGNSISVIDLDNNLVSNTIDAAAGYSAVEPAAMAVSSDGARLYVANRGSDDVSIIDVATEHVVANIVVGVKPTGLALLPDDSKLYVSNRDAASVSVLDLASATVVATLSVSDGPMALVASPDGERVYVAHAFGGNENDLCGVDATPVRNSVSVIDVASTSVLPGTITVGATPLGLVVTGDNAKLYSVSACADVLSGKGSVSKLATASIDSSANLVADNIETVARGTALLLSPDSKELYIIHPHAVSVLEVASDSIVAAPINVRGAGPTKLALSADGGKLYAIHPGSDSVSVVDVGSDNDGGTFLAALAVGSRPSDLAITTRPSGNQVVVSNAGFSRTPDTRISIIDVTAAGLVDDQVQTIVLTDTSVNPPTTGRGPIAIAISRDNSRAFIANFGDFFSNEREPGRYLSQVDLQSLQVTNFDSYGEWLAAVAVDPQATLNVVTGVVDPNDASDGVVYVADFLNDSIARGQDGNPATALSVFNNIERPAAIAIADHLAIVADYRTNNVAGTDVTTLVEIGLNGSSNNTVQLPGVNAAVLAVTPDQSVAYLLHGGDRSFLCGAADDQFCQTGNTLSAIELPFGNVATPVTTTLTLGRRPSAIAFTPDIAAVPKRAFVSNYFDGTVSVIEPWNMNGNVPAVVATLNVGKGPSGIVVNAQGTRAYVANAISNTISVIDIDNASFGAVVGTVTLAP